MNTETFTHLLTALQKCHCEISVTVGMGYDTSAFHPQLSVIDSNYRFAFYTNVSVPLLIVVLSVLAASCESYLAYFLQACLSERAMVGVDCITHCGIVSSCLSCHIVKHFWSCV